MWLAVSSFMVMGFVSGLSLADRSDSEPFLVMLAFSTKMDARERDPSLGGGWTCGVSF